MWKSVLSFDSKYAIFHFGWNYHVCIIYYGPMSTERLILVLVLYSSRTVGTGGNHSRCWGKTTPPPFYFIFFGKLLFWTFLLSVQQKWLRNGSHIMHSYFQCQTKFLLFSASLTSANVPTSNICLSLWSQSVVIHFLKPTEWFWFSLAWLNEVVGDKLF